MQNKHSQLLNLIIARLKLCNVFLFKRQVGLFKQNERHIRISKKGQADLYGFIVSHKKKKSFPIEIEVKIKKDKLTNHQKIWRQFCLDNYIVWKLIRDCSYESDIEDIINFVNEI